MASIPINPYSPGDKSLAIIKVMTKETPCVEYRSRKLHQIPLTVCDFRFSAI